MDLPPEHRARSLAVILGEEGLAPDATLLPPTTPHPGPDGLSALVSTVEVTLAQTPDVLLINLSLDHRYPVIQSRAVRAVLRRAWDAGCLPIVAAGNAQHDLADARDLESGRALQGVPEVQDPSWLLVGALHPQTGAAMGTTGPGVHCRHWGHNVKVPGIRRFSGSSAAAAVVTGLALLLVGGMRAQGQVWTPRSLRDTLADPRSQDPHGMPILQRLLTACGLDAAA